MSIVIDDVGIICSLGQGKKEVSQNLLTASPIPELSEAQLISGSSVPVYRCQGHLPDIEDRRFHTRTNQLLAIAIDQIRPSIQTAKGVYGARRIGVVMATNTSGMEEGTQAYFHYKNYGHWPKTYVYDQQEPANPSTFVADYLGLTGPAYTVSTACSAGNKAIIAATRLIKAGICDAVVTGGTDSLCQITLNGFDTLELLSDEISNPFSANRKGINLGEGAAAFLLLRGHDGIQILGYGESSDAYHMSSPHPEGKEAMLAIQDALHMAELSPKDIAYINLHGTGTELNDASESACLKGVFGDQLPLMSSTKPLTGHCLGASGAIETAFLYLCLTNERNGKIPLPTHVFDGVLDPALPKMNLTRPNSSVASVDGQCALMNNAFAFGGSNTSIILGRIAHD